MPENKPVAEPEATEEKLSAGEIQQREVEKAALLAKLAARPQDDVVDLGDEDADDAAATSDKTPAEIQN